MDTKFCLLNVYVRIQTHLALKKYPEKSEDCFQRQVSVMMLMGLWFG